MAQSGTLFDMLGTDENKRRQASRARSIDKLSEIGGLASQPQSPLAAGTAGLGINPDQAKMAGSSAQLQAAPTIAPPKGPAASAVAQGATPEQQQAQEQQRAQAATAATAGDLALKQLAADWESQVGSLGQRVAANAGSAITGAMTQAVAGQATINEDNLKAKFPDDVAKQQQARDLVNAYNTNRDADPAARAKALDELGKLMGMEALDGTVLLAPSDADAYARSVAQNAPDKVTIQQLNEAAAKAGTATVLDTAAVSAQLGLDAATVAGMSVAQIRDAIKSKLDSTFSETDKLRNSLNDATLSATDRADIRAQLENAGERGLEATEAEMQDLSDSVSKVGQITAADGTQYDLEKLLQDRDLQALVMAYNDPTSPTHAEALEALEAIPELKAFIDDNKSLVAAASIRAIKSSEDWDAVEKAQAATSTMFATDPDVLSKLKEAAGLPTSGPIYDTAAWDAFTKSPTMSMISQALADPKTKEQVPMMVSNMGTALDKGVPLEALQSYSKADLDAMGFSDDSVKWDKSVDILQAAASDDEDAVWDALIPTDSYGAPVVDVDVLTNSLATAGAAAAWFGEDVVPRPDLLKLLDTDGDNKISPTEMKAATANPAMIGKLASVPTAQYSDVVSPAFAGPLGEKLFNALSDGSMSDSEFVDVMTSDKSLITPANLERLLGSRGMDKKLDLLGAVAERLVSNAVPPSSMQELAEAQAEYDRLQSGRPPKPKKPDKPYMPPMASNNTQDQSSKRQGVYAKELQRYEDEMKVYNEAMKKYNSYGTDLQDAKLKLTQLTGTTAAMRSSVSSQVEALMSIHNASAGTAFPSSLYETLTDAIDAGKAATAAPKKKKKKKKDEGKSYWQARGLPWK